MIKKIITVFLLATTICNAQYVVKGKLEPQNSANWIVLYQLKGANQLYIGNSPLEEGTFEITFPENAEQGMYRLLFDMENNGFVDFIFNQKSIELTFNPTVPVSELKFENSIENENYSNYKIKSGILLQQLDSIQVSYLSIRDDESKKLASKAFEHAKKSYLAFQNDSEIQSSGMFANHLIKSDKRYFSNALNSNAQLFFNERKDHFFDFVDFQNEELLKSTFLSEMVVNYVFYLNRSDDLQVQNLLYKQAVDLVVEKIGTSEKVKKELLTVLLHTFAQLEEAEQIDYLIANHYKQLPPDLQNVGELEKILDRVKLSIGRKAPDFQWNENAATKTLHTLDNAEMYLLVFWSTDCSHCLIEIPMLYDYAKDKKNLHVISYTLERDELGYEHHTKNLQGWTHILGLEKWENPTSRLYEITETPTYFVLDKNKRIIAKPEFFRDFKTFYESK